MAAPASSSSSGSAASKRPTVESDDLDDLTSVLSQSRLGGSASSYPLRSIERSSGPRKQLPCQFFAARGFCRYGDKCFNAHESAGAGGKANRSFGSGRSAPPERISNENYLGSTLHPAEAHGYRAAGVLVFKRDAKDGSISILFGRQNESKPEKAGRLNYLGGKLTDYEKATETAARKVWEETGRLLADQASDLRERIECDEVMWIRDSKYALFFLELRGESEESICERYAVANADGALNTPLNEIADLHWVALPTLLEFLAEPAQRTRGPQDRCDEPVDTTSGLALPMMSFSVCITRDPLLRAKLEKLQKASIAAAAKANKSAAAAEESKGQSSTSSGSPSTKTSSATPSASNKQTNLGSKQIADRLANQSQRDHGHAVTAALAPIHC